MPYCAAVLWWNVVWASSGSVTVKLKAKVPTTATARITLRSKGVLNTYLRPSRSCPFSRTIVFIGTNSSDRISTSATSTAT